MFPQCFGVVPSEDALTESQLGWLQCQLLLDDGADACPQCGAIDLGRYCRHCGTLKEEQDQRMRTCEHCHMEGIGPYCTYCGTTLHDPIVEAIEQGTYDWRAWQQSLAPFLGSFTPQERARLQAQGVTIG